MSIKCASLKAPRPVTAPSACPVDTDRLGSRMDPAKSAAIAGSTCSKPKGGHGIMTLLVQNKPLIMRYFMRIPLTRPLPRLAGRLPHAVVAFMPGQHVVPCEPAGSGQFCSRYRPFAAVPGYRRTRRVRMTVGDSFVVGCGMLAMVPLHCVRSRVRFTVGSSLAQEL